jgi:chemotaxis protein MotA
MLSLPIGFLGVCLVIYLSVAKGTWGMYLNEHSIVLVVLGSIAILLFTTPVATLKSLVHSLIELFHKEGRMSDFTEDFAALSTSKKLGHPSRHPLIKNAAEMWQQGMSQELFIVLISQKRSELEDGHTDAVQALRNLAKYPPALGMTGTVMGLIALFGNLGSDSQDTLGPSLALAMTATFFGLADRLHVRHISSKRLCKNIYQLLLLINQGEAKAIVDDEVKSRAA